MRTQGRRRPSRIDAAWIAVLLLSSLAALPLLLNAGLPNGDDVLYHAYRAGEMQRAWAQGLLAPRWADGTYFGYGSPLWHFYAPLSYWLSAATMTLTGMSALDALRLLILGCFLGMGTGMLRFARTQSGAVGGVLAATAYVFSPYLLFTLPYARAAYPEMLALALLPWLFARFEVLLRRSGGREVFLATGVFFTMVLAHNLLATLSALLLALWLIWNAVASAVAASPSERRMALQPYLRAALSYGLGLTLSAFFWLPILLEGNSVRLENLTGISLLDYSNHFVPLVTLLGGLKTPDTGAINGLFKAYQIGPTIWPLALSGFVTVLALVGLALRRGQRDDVKLRQGVFFGLLALGLLFAITPASAGLWQALTPLQYLQFPWRLLGPLAFALALLVGFNARWMLRLPGLSAQGTFVLALAALLLFAARTLNVMEWRYPTLDTSIAAYHASELAGTQRGTTFTDEYRPQSVKTMPGPTPRLLADLADGYPVNRANAPEGVAAAPIASGPEYNEWLVRAEAPFTMEVLIFAWPGWRATVDGADVEILPSREHGFITFEVPAGQHTVRVFLDVTLTRFFANVISALALVALLLLSTRLRPLNAAPRPSDDPGPRWRRTVLISAVALSVWMLLAYTFDVGRLESALGDTPASQRLEIDFDERFGLRGYDLERSGYAPGETVRLMLYWLPLREADANYSSFVHIGQVNAPPLAQADKLHPGERAMREWWLPGRGYVYDLYEIVLPQDLPEGEYTILVGLYTCEGLPEGECGNGIRPAAVDGDGRALGDAVALTTITVQR